MAVESFSRVTGGAEETRGRGYFWDNEPRMLGGQIVVQRTISGAAYFESGGDRRIAGPGCAMVFRHGEKSRYGFPPGASEAYRLRFVTFSSAGVVPLFDQLRRDFGGVIRMNGGGEAAAAFEELARRFERRDFLDRFQEAEIIHRLLIMIYREQVQATQVNDPIEFGVQYLRSHFRAPISVKTVAGECGVSRDHFIREFRRRHGETPGVMLRRLRLEHARTMLQVTDLSVAEVARTCGFADAATFCRAFRAGWGETPGAMRRDEVDPQIPQILAEEAR